MQVDYEALLDAQSALLGLAIAPEHRTGVLRYLQLAAGMATLVTEHPLTPHDESGSVFVPVSPAVPGAPAPSAGEGGAA